MSMREQATLSDRPGDPPELTRSGYDHDWFPWHPTGAEARHPFPNGARTAVSVVLQLSAAEWEPTGAPTQPAAVGGRGLGPTPDVPRMSHREFGHRVGIFRLLDLLGAAEVTPAAVVDVLTVEHHGALLDHLLPVTSEVLAGGLSASRPITSRMSENEELDYINRSIDGVARALGSRPTGWLGPEHSESERTPGLLAACGLEYVADWDNDDLPYPMPGAGLWSFPLSWELSDLSCAFHRGMSPWTWADAMIDAFDTLHAEGGGMLTVHLQPWLSGQAFRAKSVERVLDHVRSTDGVWVASPGEIVAACRTRPDSRDGAGC